MIRIRTEVDDYHRGETFGRVIAFDDERGGVVGSIKWSAYAGDVWIQWIEVAPNLRRKGIASRMVENLKKEMPGNIIWGTTTPEGESLRLATRNPLPISLENDLRRASEELSSAHHYFRKSRDEVDAILFGEYTRKQKRKLRKRIIDLFNVAVHAFGRSIGRYEEISRYQKIPARWQRYFQRKIDIITQEQTDARFAIMDVCGKIS